MGWWLIVTRADSLQEWSQGELRLYKRKSNVKCLQKRTFQKGIVSDFHWQWTGIS